MQEPKVEIKKCTASDIPTILSVALQSYREHYTYLWTDAGEAYIGRNFTNTILEKEFTEENSYFYLLLFGGEPAGFLKINDKKALIPYPKEDCLELERIYLLEKVSGKGIGKVAMDFVVNMGRERKRKVVWLKAMDSSLAVKFYRRMGFQVKDAIILDFLHMKDEFRCLLVMQHRVSG
jgi:GNAT superfamily N-acetyltransferase